MRLLTPLLAVVIYSILCVTQAKADTVYDVDLSFAYLGEGTATIAGTITTDGTLGSLTAVNFVDWDLIALEDHVYPTATATLTFTPADSSVTVTGSNIDASGTELLATSSSVLKFTSGSEFVAFNDSAVVNLLVGQGGGVADPTGLPFFATAETPEPGSLTLLGTGLLGFAGARRRWS